MTRFTVTTTPHSNGLIVQEVDYRDDLARHDLRAAIQRSMVNTMDAQVREALIALGWTPPPDKEPRDEAPRC